MVKLADGARDNWSYLGPLAGRQRAAPSWSAAEQLKAATDAAYGENNTGAERSTRSIVQTDRADLMGR